MQLFRAGCDVLPLLAKVQKWFRVRGDLRYSFAWILHCANELARIDVISQRQITGREVIQQALALNPAFFRVIYSSYTGKFLAGMLVRSDPFQGKRI